MALYKVNSPYDSAVRGMQGAAQTSAGMTRKQGEQKQDKSFGGALGSMIMGGGMGIGAADMFSGGNATKAMWAGVNGLFEGATGGAATTGTLGMAEAGMGGVTGTGIASAPVVAGMAAPVASAAGTTALPAGASAVASGMGAIEGGAAALASGGELAAGGLSSTAPAAGAAGPVGWGLLGAGALLGLASYYL